MIRFVIEPDPDRDWRFIVRDTNGQLRSDSHPTRRDAAREAKRLNQSHGARQSWPEKQRNGL